MKILLSAGEPSGDAHCARLVKLLRARHPDWTIYGLGGPEMRAAGAKLLADTMGMGVLGFTSSMKVVPRGLRLRRETLRFVERHEIDLVVPCDWGAFNGRTLPGLKERGVPVLYYFPPRSWQQRGEGGLGVVPFCQAIATPFAWSAQRLKDAGAHAEWVGHPLLEEVEEAPARATLRAEFGIDEGERVIALLPGSRAMELKLLVPVVAQTAQLLYRRGLADRFLVALPQSAKLPEDAVFPSGTQIIKGRATDVLKACDAAVVKSGTSTLQAAACDTPQVIIYDLPPLLRAQWVGTGMARKIRFIGMPNILADREICRELLGPNCRPSLIVGEIAALLEDPAKSGTMRAAYQEVRRALGSELPQGASEATVALIEELVGA